MDFVLSWPWRTQDRVVSGTRSMRPGPGYDHTGSW
jgi:hypothetical protein